VYNSPKINIQTIKEMVTQNPLIVSKLEKRLLTYFPGKIIIEALDPKQNVKPEETQIIQNMCNSPDFMLNECIIQGYFDSYCYGEGHFNPVWFRSRTRNEIILQKLRHLPAWSFDTAPTEKFTMETWSNILQGVILNEFGEPEYWQRQNSYSLDTVKIDNIIVIKDPKDEDLAGFSKLIPLATTIEMFKFILNTEMQVEHKTGSPIFFIKITNPRSAEDPVCDGVSDEAFAKLIIKNTSKDYSYVLRDNMEVIPVPFDPKKDNIKTAEFIKSIIDDYFNVSEMITKDGTLIGGSSRSELDITNQAAEGVHKWLLPQYEEILNQYFWLNGYPDGWSVRLTYKMPEPDRTEAKLKQADIGIKGKFVDLDDLRALCPDLEPADDKKKASIKEYWSSQQPAIPEQLIQNPDDEDGNTPEQFKQKAHTHLAEGEDEPLDPIAAGMKNEMDKELDILAGKILKGLAA
jgi:hypothetical protein